MLSWICLILAGLCEIMGVFAMKKFVITNKKIFLLALIVTFAFSFSFLSIAMQGIPMSVAYAIWTGIGASGGVIIGIILFNESRHISKFIFLAMIVLSSIGLKIVT